MRCAHELKLSEVWKSGWNRGTLVVSHSSDNKLYCFKWTVWARAMHLFLLSDMHCLVLDTQHTGSILRSFVSGAFHVVSSWFNWTWTFQKMTCPLTNGLCHAGLCLWGLENWSLLSETLLVPKHQQLWFHRIILTALKKKFLLRPQNKSTWLNLKIIKYESMQNISHHKHFSARGHVFAHPCPRQLTGQLARFPQPRKHFPPHPGFLTGQSFLFQLWALGRMSNKTVICLVWATTLPLKLLPFSSSALGTIVGHCLKLQ